MSATSIKRTYAADEFERLLLRAADHLVRSCIDKYCDPAPPEAVVFSLLPTEEPRKAFDSIELVDARRVVLDLLDREGRFREWINLSPLAVTSAATVLEVVYPDRFTTVLLTGEYAFPFEPFHLLGPDLPPEWDGTFPPPKVALPRL